MSNWLATGFEKEGQNLAEELRRRAIPAAQIERMLASGYYLLQAGGAFGDEPQLCVADSFYGSKWPSGLAPIDLFLSGKLEPTRVPTYTVGSLTEIASILATDRHAKYREVGRLSFRGQAREYHAHRSYPSQTKAVDGAERLIIPSFWRQFHDDWLQRFQARIPESIFTTIHGDELIYHGIPDWKTLGKRNFKRYGIHTMSDLEDFPDPESQEYGRRWREFKVEGIARRDLPLVEQHYGVETCGLDITFDVGVATFFAANRFVARNDETAHFILPSHGGHTGVLYGFVFTDPPLRKQEELVREVPVFQHLPPVRPVRQQCALPFFSATNFNEAVCDLDFVMYLAPDFEPAGLPDQRHLFPPAAEDPFYDAALKIRRNASSRSPYRQFIEYRFE